MSDRDDAFWAAATRGVKPLRKQERVMPSLVSYGPPRRPEPHSGLLDAHGLTVQQAHQDTHALIDNALRDGRRSIVVVTGRSGTIQAEFQHWLDKTPGISRIEELNGGGAYRLHLRRKRTVQ